MSQLLQIVIHFGTFSAGSINYTNQGFLLLSILIIVNSVTSSLIIVMYLYANTLHQLKFTCIAFEKISTRMKNIHKILTQNISPSCLEAHIWSWSLKWSAEWFLIQCWVNKPCAMASGCSSSNPTHLAIINMKFVMEKLND